MTVFRWILIFACLFAFQDLYGQNKKGSRDLGINITSIISAFVGNDNDISPGDVPFMFRWGKQIQMRLGLGAAAKSNEFFDVVSQAIRTSDERQFLLRLGFQKNIFQDERWGGYWGIDGIARFTQDQVRSEFGFGSNRILERTYSLGGGPLLGLRFNITNRLYLSTEANAYAIFTTVLNEESGQGLDDRKITTYDWEFNALPPLFLYLNYAF